MSLLFEKRVSLSKSRRKKKRVNKRVKVSKKKIKKGGANIAMGLLLLGSAVSAQKNM